MNESVSAEIASQLPLTLSEGSRRLVTDFFEHHPTPKGIVLSQADLTGELSKRVKTIPYPNRNSDRKAMYVDFYATKEGKYVTKRIFIGSPVESSTAEQDATIVLPWFYDFIVTKINSEDFSLNLDEEMLSKLLKLDESFISKEKAQLLWKQLSAKIISSWEALLQELKQYRQFSEISSTSSTHQLVKASPLVIYAVLDSIGLIEEMKKDLSKTMILRIVDFVCYMYFMNTFSLSRLQEYASEYFTFTDLSKADASTFNQFAKSVANAYNKVSKQRLKVNTKVKSEDHKVLDLCSHFFRSCLMVMTKTPEPWSVADTLSSFDPYEYDRQLTKHGYIVEASKPETKPKRGRKSAQELASTYRGSPVEHFASTFRKKSSKRLALVDLTDFESDSTKDPQAQRGKGKKGLSNIVKFCAILDYETAMPVLVKKFSGNKIDRSLIQDLANEVKRLGYDECIFVFDRGFVSYSNFWILQSLRIKFIVMNDDGTIEERVQVDKAVDCILQSLPDHFSLRNKVFGKVQKVSMQELGIVKADGSFNQKHASKGADVDTIVFDGKLDPNQKLCMTTFFDLEDLARDTVEDLVDLQQSCDDLNRETKRTGKVAQLPKSSHLKRRLELVDNKWRVNTTTFNFDSKTKKTHTIISNVDFDDWEFYLDLYHLRWTIELWFKAGKQGCGGIVSLYSSHPTVIAMKLFIYTIVCTVSRILALNIRAFNASLVKANDDLRNKYNTVTALSDINSLLISPISEEDITVHFTKRANNALKATGLNLTKEKFGFILGTIQNWQ